MKHPVEALSNWPAVVVHGFPHAVAALSHGRPVLLLSAVGAGWFAGVGWWRAMIVAARAECSDTPNGDVLDCGDLPGAAMAALRGGQRVLILERSCPAFAAVASAAANIGSTVLPERPPALDLADRSGMYLLPRWLAGDSGQGLR